MSKTVHSIKLIPYDSVELDNLTYSNGEIVFDSTSGTIRVMNGATQGGASLATRTWTSTNFAPVVNGHLSLLPTVGQPTDTENPARWLKVTIGGTTYFIPGFQ